MTRGLILFAHGARDAAWAEPLQATTRMTQARLPEWAVALAFLEFLAPGLPDCGAAMVAKGCTEIDVVPLFLGAGGHVRRDLPRLVAELQDRFPTVTWRLRHAVGESPLLMEAMAAAACGLALAPDQDAQEEPAEPSTGDPT